MVDGVCMAEAEARVFWARFSEHMEKNKGDLAGFARAEGFASVRPVMTPAGPELLVSRSAKQEPYRKAESKGSSAGSRPNQGNAPRSEKPGGNRSKR